MSTPTTATATLHNFPYPNQLYSSGSNPSSPYLGRSNLPPASTARLVAPGYQQYSASNAPSIASTGSSHTLLNGVNPSSPTRPNSKLYRSHQLDYSRGGDPVYHTNSATLPAPVPSQTRTQTQAYTQAQARAHNSQSQMADDYQSGRNKRRRSNGPDWNEFYKHGLPREVIVIDDDSPAPESDDQRPTHGVSTAPSTSLAAGATIVNPLVVSDVSSDVGSRSHVAKKRKRDDETARYDPVHNRMVGGPVNTPSGSTVSSDRTNSANHTTAATSLGSLSSNGQYDYEVQPGQKRKRATRQQVAEDQKRREAANPHAFSEYQPPPYPPKKAGEVNVRIENDKSYNNGAKVDDDDGHYIVVPDADLTNKYQMNKLLGQGTFGKVVQARDKKKNELVAIKIIRSVQKYRDASRIELRVLQTLKANDHNNRNRCIHLRDCFDFRGHICIVMDLLGQSVFDFLKGNNFVPFPNSQIQSFARQLFTSVAFLHDLNLIHTDLKPENILLADNTYQTFTYNRKIPSSSTTVNRQANQRRVLLDTEIRLIDFGSATFQDEYHSSVVSTRHYRAPEIILGLGWSYPCDIWSIGCILVEFYTGDALFQTHDNLEHLAMMEAVCDKRIDSALVQQVTKASTRNGGNPAAQYFKRLKLDYPTSETSRGSRRFVRAMKKLNVRPTPEDMKTLSQIFSDIIPSNNHNNFTKQFLHLLKQIFIYDPAQRITAKEALNHQWFKEIAHPDDGTEAAKIRQERQGVVREAPRTASRLPQAIHA